MNDISNEMDGKAFRAPQTQWILGPLAAHVWEVSPRELSGRIVGNPETDRLPAPGSISEWPVIRPELRNIP